jgi:Protease inhibitor Inh
LRPQCTVLELLMSGLTKPALWRGSAAKAAVVLLAIAALGGCASSRTEPPPEAAAAPPPPPPPSSPPPTDLTGRWKLTVAASGACFMNFGHAPAAAQGTIAPEGGCPGNFYTSRKWTFERGALIIRDHKSEALAELSFAGGHFEGHQADGSALSLSR